MINIIFVVNWVHACMQEEEDKVDLDHTVSVFSLRFVWVSKYYYEVVLITMLC